MTIIQTIRLANSLTFMAC